MLIWGRMSLDNISYSYALMSVAHDFANAVVLDDRDHDHVLGILDPDSDPFEAGQVGAELPVLLDQVMPFIAGERWAKICM